MPKVKKKSSPKKKLAKRKKVSPIPKGFQALTPYLIVGQAKKALAFYKKAFNAKTNFCMEHGKGKIGHAELTIFGSKLMLADDYPEMGACGPEYFGGSPAHLYLYVKNVDAVVKRAVAAGAKLIRPVEDLFYGDRSGAIQDPYGYKWYIATRIENLTFAQVKKRAIENYGKNKHK